MLSKYLERNLANRINFWVFICVFSVILVIGLATHTILKSVLTQSIVNNIQIDATSKADRIGDSLKYLINNVSSLSINTLVTNSLVDSSGRDAYLKPFLIDLNLLNRVPSSIYLFDFQGELIASTKKNNDGSFPADVKQFTAELLAKDQPIIELVKINTATFQLFIGFPVIFPPTEMTEGLISVVVNMSDLVESTFPFLENTSKSFSLSTEKNGVIWTNSFAQSNSKFIAHSQVPSIAPFQELDLQFSIEENKDLLVDALADINNIVFYFGLLLLIISIIFSRYLSNRLTAPISELSRKSQSIADGQLVSFEMKEDVRIDEIGVLANSFNKMVLSLQSEKESLEEKVASRTSDLVNSRNELKLSASVFQHSNEGFFITDTNGRIVSVNPAFEKITGLVAIQFLSTKITDFPFTVLPDTPLKYVWNQLKLNGHWKGEIQGGKNEHEIFTCLVTINSVVNEQGYNINFVGTITDISERKVAEQNSIYQANHDSLTGLENRSSLENHINKFISKSNEINRASDQYKDHVFALLFMDLDNFKQINDSLGHRTGDKLLRGIANNLITGVRENDLVARLGGDEFVILLHGAGTFDVINPIAEKINRIVTKPIKVDGSLLHSSISIGISIYPTDGQDYDTLLTFADQAMYVAKQKGKGTYQYFNDSMRIDLLKTNRLINLLRNAIANEEFELYYQPKIDIRNNTIYGYEALIRWCVDGNFISPFEFISIAEKYGLIIEIGNWVLEQAVLDCKRYHDEGFKDIKMAVNFSPLQLVEPDVVNKISDTLEKNNLNPKFLEIEMTESVLMNDTYEIKSNMAKLSEMGICLTLDDFGTGYSSLSYLKRFPIQRLKIDRSFIQDIADNKNSYQIVEAIILMCEGLDLNVIAEGIETIEQLNILNKLNCVEYQGYYFGVPLPYSKAVALLNNWAEPFEDSMIS